MAEAGKEEQIGFHKGALSTLAKEREELVRMTSIVEQLMQMHVKALQELGVDLQKMAEQAQAQARGAGQSKAAAQDSKSDPIEDLVK